MVRNIVAVLVACIAVVQAEPGQADIQPKVIRKCKRATALVLVPRRGFATAFCIDKAGFFVTTQHAVGTSSEKQKVTLILNPGEANEVVMQASVRRLDEKADLALLHVVGAKGLTPLTLGTVKGLTETQRLIALGYPFGTLTALRQKKYPSVSVNLGRITSLRKLNGKLIRIQLDAQLNAGNSGGPVLDEQGNVVGIVKSGFRSSGVNFAIPVSDLRDFLARPVITFQPPVIKTEKQHDPTQFTIRADSFGGKPAGDALELVLTADGKTRRFPAKPSGQGIYTVTAVPIPGAQASGVARPISLALLFPKGKITCVVKDQKIGRGPKNSISLSELLQVDVKKKTATLVTRDGRRMSVPRAALKPVQADLGGSTISVDLSKCTRIIVNSAPKRKDPDISYQIVVRRKGRIVGELKGVLSIRSKATGAQAQAPAPSITSPALVGEKTIVRLPASFKRLVIGGGGRYLILHIPRLNKLAVFDVASARVVHYVPAPSGDFLFTAGADKLIIHRTESKTFERWSLTTFEKEFTARVQMKGPVKIIEVGSNSRGPILVWSNGDPLLLDIATFKELDSIKDLRAFSGGRNPVHGISYQASSGGTAFTAWYRQSPTYKPFLRMMRYSGDSIATHSVNVPGGVHTGVTFAQASPDGSHVYTSQGYIYSDSLKPIDAPDLAGAYLIPAGNAYFTSLRWQEVGTRKKKKLTLSIHLAADRHKFVTLNNLEEMDDLASRQPTLEKRFHLVPSADVLITIPAINDQIVIRRLNLDAALKHSGHKYLFVDSTPIRSASRTKFYSYQVSVKSKSGGVRYKLISAPEGMRIEDSGRLIWQVPAEFTERSTTVIVNVRNNDGLSVFHTFDIQIR